MPIYEYLCSDCNRVYKFMAKSHAQTQRKKPTCPKCGKTNLDKTVSSFAITKGQAKKDDDHKPDTPESELERRLDDPRVEREMMKLMAQAEHMDENNPRQMGQFMRKLCDVTGENMTPEIQEAIRRLEAGEDPEKIEEDLGDAIPEDMAGLGGGGPSYDDGLYPYE